MSILLEVKNLQAFSREGHALSPQISFNLEQGEVLFLRGENGAGKSTLLKTLLGLHPHYSGVFQFQTRPEKIQYLPQLGNLNFHLPMTLQDMLNGPGDSTLLKGLDLSKKWNTASGGERQKILFTSVLQKSPQILFLDEPFNHVDKDACKLLEDSLGVYLKENPQSALVLISHRAIVQDWPRVRFVEIR